MTVTKGLDKLADQTRKREARDKELLGKRPSFADILASEREAAARNGSHAGNGRAVEQKAAKETKGSNGLAGQAVNGFQDLARGVWRKLEKIYAAGGAASRVSSDDINSLGELLRKRAHKQPLTNGEAQRAISILQAAGEEAAVEQKETEVTKGGKGKLSGNTPRPVGGLVSIDVELNCIHRHPKNRQATKEAVKELAASIDENELQQPILLRKPPAGSMYPLASGHYQIVFGERRFAAHELLGRKTIRAFVREDLDDVATLKLMAEENSKRDDLNPVERARLIETLTQPIADGGGGLQVKEAAAHVGFADAASASNAVRILKLPAKWLDRVAAGELPETFARLLTPICHAPKLMDIANAIFEAEQKGKSWKPPQGLHYGFHGFERRDEVEGLVNYLLREATRPVAAGDKRHYSDYRIGVSGEYPMLFQPDEKTRQQLDIREFTIGKETRQLATHWQLYDKLQWPEVKKHFAEHGRKTAAKKAANKSAKKALTPEQQKERDKQADELLARHVAAWRSDWLRRLVADQLATDLPLRERVMLLIAANCIDVWSNDTDEAMCEAVAKYQPVKSQYAKNSSAHVYDVIAAAGRSTQALTAATIALCQSKLCAEDDDWRYSSIEREMIDELAVFAGIDLAQCWQILQVGNQRAVAHQQMRLEALYRLHNSRQLDALGKELGVHVADAKSTDAKVQLLMTRERLLKLPKCIAPLPKPKASRKGAKARRGK